MRNLHLLTRTYSVFENLPVRNVISWTSLISSYGNNGYAQTSLDIFDHMQIEGVSPNEITYVCCLKACARIGASDKGKYMHGEIERLGMLVSNPFLGGALVDMYAKCGLLKTAQEVLDSLPIRNVVSWTALIAGYVEHEHGEKALECIKKMQKEGIHPNAATFVCSLRACSSILAIEEGQKFHAEIKRNGKLEEDLIVGSALVAMYAKFGLLDEVQTVFDKLPTRDVISWTALISGYAKHGYSEDALRCVRQMELEGVSPNAITTVSNLKACATVGVIGKGMEIHSQIENGGFLRHNMFIGTSLVDMYGKCGLVEKAQEVFDKLLVHSVVSWNALISGYVVSGHDVEALKCVDEMQLEGLLPDAVTFICCIKACGNIGAISKGCEMHAAIAKAGLSEGDCAIGCSLVDMYTNFGWLLVAKEVFDKLPVHNVVSWNSLITCYSQHGEHKTALESFHKMLDTGVRPDAVTFIILLNTCSRACLFEKGHSYFERMTEDYAIVPIADHHSCLVDTLGRIGKIEDAINMIKGMSYSSNSAMWSTVLDACKTMGNIELGNYIFKHLMCMKQSMP